jgi:hypothetical protein
LDFKGDIFKSYCVAEGVFECYILEFDLSVDYEVVSFALVYQGFVVEHFEYFLNCVSAVDYVGVAVRNGG